MRKIKEAINRMQVVIGKIWRIIFLFESIRYKKLLNRNKALKDFFVNSKRCFVAGSGSSLNNLNVELLENEIIIGINAGYLKKEIVRAKTKMWIIIDYFFLDPLPIDAIRAIEENVGDAIYFVPVQAKPICEKYQLFVNKKVYYLFFSSTINNKYINTNEDFLNISSPIFKPIGSAETAVICAAYLGFKDIFLIGCDSDWFARLDGERRHFFKESENEHSIDHKIPKDWVDHDVMESKLYYGYLLYKSYRLLNNLISKKKVRIFNASGGGLLDVFPWVEYRELF